MALRKKVIIIAEAGVNHNGSQTMAYKLVDAAYKSGADYIKFQTFKTELNISKSAKKAKYQIENTNNKVETQFEMIKKLELSFESFIKLKKYCEDIGIGFLSTGFDLPSIDFLDELEIDYFKISSGEITNKPLLNHLASKKRPIILSTGMAKISEIRNAIDVLTKFTLKKEDITVLHCNTEYPTPLKDVNLTAMLQIKDEVGVKIGYSDHTLGIHVAIAAVALGAKVIEKHFTLDKSLPGPDHMASLEPNELKDMIIGIRNIELATSGSGIKEVSDSERPNVIIARKSIHVSKNLERGHILAQKDLIMKRPGDGISPMEIDSVIGKTTTKNLTEDSKLEWKHLK